MTDYRNKFLNGKTTKSLIDSTKKEELFDRAGNNLLKPTTAEDYKSEAESERFVKAFIKQRTRYIPEIDYTSPETFSYYGSAEKYYVDSVERIYKTYPYDGSKAEKMEWSLTASYLDLHVLESEYPKEKGHVTFANGGWGTRAAVDGNYGLSSNPQYIYFVGGPHSGTIFNSSKNRENNLKIDGATGNTVEFWMKKPSFVGSTLTTREVIFDVHTTGAITGTSTHGRFMLSLDSAVGSGSPFKLTYLSGTAGVTDQVLGTATVTKSTIADNQWHYYAVTAIQSGSNLITKLYVDGTLQDTNTTSVSSFGAIDRNFVGTIGSLASASAGSGKIGYGKLSGSLDEFRYWKQARTEKQIGTNWYRPVHGGTDNDHTNASLGLYYKFNEGVTNIQAYDEVVLDYSGRINNGKVIGWAANFRTGSSGIELSTNLPESSYTEPADPIINSANSRVQTTLTKLKNIGQSHDLQNPSSLVNTVPSYFMTEDKTGQMRELMQIISSTLDDLFLKIKFLPKVKDYNYQDFFNKTGVHKNADMNNFLLGCEGSYNNEFNGTKFKPWMSQVLEHFGMVTTEIFAKSELMETFLSHTEKVTFEQNLHEVKNAILSNIHANLIHIYNTKGTEASFRNIIRCFGIDDDLIKLNVYGNNEVYKIEKKPVYTTVKQKSLNFANQNYQGTIFQTASNNLYEEQRYFTGSTTPKPITLEANVIFPEQSSLNSTFASASLFGMHSVHGASGSSDALTWHTNDHASMQAYFVRRNELANDGYFFLTSSNGTFDAISSDYIPDIYGGSHWNISVRIASKGDIDFGLNKLSGSGTYKVDFAGYNYDLDILKNSFHVTSSITRQQYEQISRLDRAVYAGSHRTNFSGSQLANTDIRLLAFNVWLDGLSTDELKEHAKNPSIYGRTNPDHVSNFDDGSNLRAVDSLVLRWQFENHQSSSASGTLTVTDYTSGSADTVSGSIIGYKYQGHASGFVSTGSAIAQDFIPSVEYAPVDNVYSSDKVKIKNTELEKFEADSRPVTYFYSFEKSMYQVISKEMIKFFAGITGIGNIIGEPVNKYRLEYKAMEKLREKFFSSVENDIDLDKFVEYYRWIDSSISHFVQQLVPASAHFAGRIRDVVESHMLERNKFKYQPPTVEYKDPTVNPTNILGINELLYDWEHGHAPLSGEDNDNCLWQKDRSERGEAGRDTINRIITTDVSGSTYAIRSFSRPYRFSAEQSRAVKASFNRNGNKDPNLYKLSTKAGNITLDADRLQELSACNDESELNELEHYRGPANVQGNDSYLNADSDMMFPFTMVSSSVGVDLDQFKDNMKIANNHLDIGIHGEQALQSSFTRQHVGGMPHRKVKVSLSPQPVKSVGSITIAAATSTGVLHGDTFTLIDALGTSQEFTFNGVSASKTGGTIGLSGTGAVIAKIEAIRDAINNIAGLGITAGAIVNTDDAGIDGDHKLTLTQDIPGTSGDTTIDVSGVSGATSENFTGGAAATYTRPEAYHLTAAANQLILTSASIGSPKSMFYRDIGGQLNYVFKNIQYTTASSFLGNYSKDYEIVQTTGRAQNNRQFVDDNGFSYTTSVATNLSGPVDFAIPTRRKNNHVIVNKFSAPGGPETQAAFASDQESQEFSIYNTNNYRNSNVRNLLNKLSSEQSDQFGYRSGSSTQASIHMTNRNASRRTGSKGEEVNFDNNFIQHPIPQSDYQYSWVTASVGDSIYNFLSRNNNQGYVSEHKLINSKYTRDFSQETSGTIPTDYKTNQSERTSSFIDITRIETIKESPDNSSFRFANQVSISHDVVAVINNREQETTDTTLYIFRSGASGYVQEFASVVAKASEPVYGVSNSGPKQAIVTSVTNHGSWVACAVSGGASTSTPDCIKIFRSSSSGWALNEGLTGSAIGFKSPAHLAMTASSAGVYRLAAINTGSVKIFTHFSASGWYNSGNNVTDLTAVATHSPATQSSGLASYYGYLSIHGDLATAGSRIVVGNQDGFSVLLSGSGWSEEDTIVPSDWSYKPEIATNYDTSETFSIPFVKEPANFKNNIDLHEDVFAIITSTAIDDASFPMSYSIPSLQVWKRSGSNWSLYQEMDPIFSDHAENSNTRVLSIAIDKGLLFVGVTERDIYFDGNTFQGESGEQDYGSIVVYADDGSSYKKQRELFSGEPAERGGLGSSMRAKGGKLIAGAPAISTYAKSRNPTLSYHLSTDITNAVIFEYEQTAETDKSLRGPKIAGPENSRAFAMSGQSSFFTEVEQIPSILVGSLGRKLRVIEKTNLVTQKIPEFVVELEYIQGSNDASDIANSSYGLTNDPSGFFVVQYKLGNGTWKNTSIHTTSGKKNSFTKIRSKPINNPDNKKIGLRILNVTDEFSQAEWAFKNINIIPSRDSYDSSKQLIKDTQYRSVSTRQIHNSVNSVFFDGVFQDLSASTSNNAPIYFTDDGAGGNDNPFSIQAWLKPEVTRGGHRIILDLGRNYFMSISSSVDNPAYLDFTFSCYSSSVGFSWNPTYQNRLGIKKSSFLENGKWSNVVVTYDGSKEFNGFALYLNGRQNLDAEKFNLVRSGQNYHGMAGPGRREGDGLQRRHLSIGLPGQFVESTSNTETTLSYRGYINNLVIFNKKLQASEVSDLYGLKNNVNDLSIESGDILDFKHTSLHSDAVLWYPFTTLGSASKGSTHSPLYYDQINNMEIRLQTAQFSDPTFLPKIQSTAWDVPNTTETYTINSDTNTINSISSTGSYLQNTLSPYSWPTWKQIRGSENPIIMDHKKKNIISLSKRGDELFPSVVDSYKFGRMETLANLNETAKRSEARTVTNFIEPAVTDRFAPMTITLYNRIAGGLSFDKIRLINEDAFLTQQEEENAWNFEDDSYSLLTTLRPEEDGVAERAPDNRLLLLRKTYQNEMTMFANPDLNEELNVVEVYDHQFEKMIISMQRSITQEDGVTIEMNYVEDIFPREENTYLSKVRLREKFDFFGWKLNRNSRSLRLTGSNAYGTSLVQAGVGGDIYPDITVNKDNFKESNPFFVDTIDSNSSLFPTRFHHIESSTWPLDSREDFALLPTSITSSYFTEGETFMEERLQGLGGEGVLQNDYSIFGLGINTIHGTPPPAPLYNRRIPQTYGSRQLLAGEAQWQAGSQASIYPFEDTYREYRESIRLLGQDHSIVPEFRISEFIEDTINNKKSRFNQSANIKDNYLSLTGALYQNADGDVAVGSSFYKTYATSDFMKYFQPVMAHLDEEEASNDLDPLRITLKCQAAMKFIPYYGFYPAERVLQIANLFAKGYMPEFSFRNTLQDSRISSDDLGVSGLLDRKIRANLQQTIKPLMAPGVLFNSIKSGMAVDYPLFGKTSDLTTVAGNFATSIATKQTPVTSFDATLNSLSMFTGSIVSNTIDQGIPRLSGSVYKRVTFEELLSPDSLIGTEIIDNEPHPSASIYYGNSETSRIFDYPYTVGQLDSTRNERLLNAAEFSLKKPLSESLLPYKMAVNNFCAETVKFFLEDSSVATLESEEVEVRTEANTDYKMRVYLRNKDLKMYDRHSAFGPPVDEGKNLTFSQIQAKAIIVSGSSATKDFGFANYNFDLPSGSVDHALPGFAVTGSNGGNASVRFVKSSSNIPGTKTNITTAVETAKSTRNVSQYGDLYIKDKKCYIDLSSIKTNFPNPFSTRSPFSTTMFMDRNRSSALIELIAAALQVQAHKSGSGVSATTAFSRESDVNLFPPGVTRDSSTLYLRKSLKLFQTGAAGAAGRTNILELASSSVNQYSMRHYLPTFPVSGAFEGGTDTTTTSKLVDAGTVTKNYSHGFAPFHPPFLDVNAEPYVEITYNNSTAGTYGLDEIWENSTFTYYNFKSTPSNATNDRYKNANYNHAMSLSASLDLKSFVQYEREEDDGDAARTNRKRWVIQTKWETPLIQFSEVEASALRLDNNQVYQTKGSPWQKRTWTEYFTDSLATSSAYLTASSGMWHQYGAVPESSQGYELSVEEVSGISDEHQLARLLGFTTVANKSTKASPGILSAEKKISEAVVAMPYYTTERGRVQFFSMDRDSLDGAKKYNKKIKKALRIGALSEDEYEKYYENPQQDKLGFMAYQLRMMEKYVIPPQFDFYTYPKLANKFLPMMYIFQFRAKMNAQDLSNIWQNLSPTSAASTAKARYSSTSVNKDMFDLESDVQYVSHFLDFDKTVMNRKSIKEFLENDVRWMVFKVKLRAEKDLAKVKRDSLPGKISGKKVFKTSLKDSGYFYKYANVDPVKNESLGVDGLKLKYSFNWPYDYFSMVELVKIGTKVDFLPRVDDQRE